MPCDWSESLGADFRGRVRYRRRFHRPTGLVGQRVSIVCECVDVWASVDLNGCPLGTFTALAPFRADVTDQLRDQNELCVDVELPSTKSEIPRSVQREHLGGGLIGEVRLEIG